MICSFVLLEILFIARYPEMLGNCNFFPLNKTLFPSSLLASSKPWNLIFFFSPEASVSLLLPAQSVSYWVTSYQTAQERKRIAINFRKFESKRLREETPRRGDTSFF